MHKTFEKLREIATSTHILSSVERTLFWDQETMMPEDGIGIKTLQKKELAALIHEKKTASEYVDTLAKLIDLDSGKMLTDKLCDEHTACVKLMREDYLKAKKLPTKFVKKLAEVSSKATHVWIQARKDDDFKTFAPHLTDVIELMREKADILGYKEHPYDPMVDEFEPHMTASTLTKLFTPLKEKLIELTQEYSQYEADTSFMTGDFDEAKQLAMGRDLLQQMGLNPKASRLDLSAHPFCMPVHPTDLRLTTHIEENSFFQALSATMHEGGHGLYEQGIDANNFGLPLGEATSIGVHESQSKLWETCVGQSLPFWKGFLPTLQKTFPQLGSVQLDTFYQAINQVKPSLIRIHADEVTYSLHVILRFEIEKAFMEGKLEVKDLPEVWNTKMKESLGIVPDSNANGCMQDIHWASALFGYFPTYALGNLYAAQLFNAIKADFPNLDDQLASGKYLFIRDWLIEHVHKHGRHYAPQQLIERATSKKLAIDDFIAYLTTKYSALTTPTQPTSKTSKSEVAS